MDDLLDEWRFQGVGEQEDKARIEWLRSAAKEDFDAIERGDHVTLRSDQEFDDFVDQLRQKVSGKLGAE